MHIKGGTYRRPIQTQLWSCCTMVQYSSMQNNSPTWASIRRSSWQYKGLKWSWYICTYLFYEHAQKFIIIIEQTTESANGLSSGRCSPLLYHRCPACFAENFFGRKEWAFNINEYVLYYVDTLLYKEPQIFMSPLTGTSTIDTRDTQAIVLLFFSLHFLSQRILSMRSAWGLSMLASPERRPEELQKFRTKQSMPARIHLRPLMKNKPRLMENALMIRVWWRWSVAMTYPFFLQTLIARESSKNMP